MARSGFLSVVGLTQVPISQPDAKGKQQMIKLPQQPTNDLIFYYVHSLMAVTKILLCLSNQELSTEPAKTPLIIENIAVDNLMYLCQGVFSMREIGLWNNRQGQNWLDGGAPFYSIYRSKDGQYFTVACIERKFYVNFLSVLRDKCNLSNQEFHYLEGNQLNEDEWPDMEQILQRVFSNFRAKHLEEAFNSRDCCVQRVLTPQEALKSTLAKEIVVSGRKAQKLHTPIWKELIREAGLKNDVIILPPAKL